MAASLSKQVAAMDTLAWRVTYEWNRAKGHYKTIETMQAAWQCLTQSPQYQCLADKRKESIHFLWHHTRTRVLAENQVLGRWCDGVFYANWCDLPEEYKRNDAMLPTLPVGHFWLDDNRKATTIRYFISSDCANEDRKHFSVPSAVLTAC